MGQRGYELNHTEWRTTMRVLERRRNTIDDVGHEPVVLDAPRDRSSRILLAIDIAAVLTLGAWLLAAVLGR